MDDLSSVSDRAGAGEEETAGDFVVAPLRGRHVHLRPVVAGDYETLRLAELDGELGVRWRFRGGTPSPEQWAQSISQSALAQFLVVRNDNNGPIGVVIVYRANFQDGHAYLGAASFDGRGRSPLMMLGAALFIDYVFACWGFYKLYMDMPEYNFRQLSSAVGRFLKVEGRLSGHVVYGGRRWDQLILALYREVWSREGRQVVAAARAPAVSVARVRFPPGMGRE